MVDWLTHSLVGWITGKTIKQEIGLVVIGSLIPDIFKLYPVFDWFIKGDTQNFFLPIHTPFGAVLIVCVIALFFHDIKKALVLLGIGVATHFILDLLLLNVSGGMLVLFPFSWDEWHLDLIRSDDYMITIYAIMAAVVVYSIYFVVEKRKLTQYQLSLTTSNIFAKNAPLSTAKKDIFPSVTTVRANPQLYYVDNQIHNQMKTRELKRFKNALLEKKPATFSEIDTMTGFEFEDFLIDLFTTLGYRVERRKRSHEQGFDLLLERHGERTAVRVKRYNKPVGNKAVQEANAIRDYYRCTRAVVVTNSSFTTSAKQFAERCNVELWDRKKLKEKIKNLIESVS